MVVDVKAAKPIVEVRGQIITAVNQLYFETYVRSLDRSVPYYGWFEGQRLSLASTIEKITHQPIENPLFAMSFDYQNNGTFPNEFHIGGDQFMTWSEGLSMDILAYLGDVGGRYDILKAHMCHYDDLHPKDPNLRFWRQLQEAYFIWKERDRVKRSGTAWNDFKTAGAVLQHRQELIFPLM